MASVEDLKYIMPFAGGRAEIYAGPLNTTMLQFAITSPQRACMFLAQIAHESGELRYVCELASGDAYDPTGPRPDLAERLGNIYPGDGPRYKGRGLLQITGRANYDKCGTDLGLDLLDQPELLEKPEHAALSAGWYWDWKNLNALADMDDFKGVTRKINGGYNGMDERLMYWKRAKARLMDFDA
jgi:putative chitinase